MELREGAALARFDDVALEARANRELDIQLGWETYSAAKAWVNSFSEWAANEYRAQGVTVMALCPGFTKTEFHERMNVKRGTGLMWLDVDFLVAKALSDFDKGRVYSIPGAQYRAIAGLTNLVPNRALQLAQSLGRK